MSSRFALAMMVLLASFAWQSTPASAATTFSDLADAGAHRPAIEALEETGILAGTGCDLERFCPDEPLRRWVMAVWLVRAIGEEDRAVGGVSAFSNMEAVVWWLPYVNRLRQMGISDGCERVPARQCPNQTVTRAEMAGVLTRAFNLGSDFDFEDRGAYMFTDVGGSDAFSVEVLARSGVTTGCATDPFRFCPDKAVTRGEMATLLARALGLVPVVEYLDDGNRQGRLHLVSQYTTYFSCCAARVINIRSMADIVDGAVISPGNLFSLNGYVGRRTYGKGFVTADTLVNGRLVGSVGGGVSQFATTLYNAVFWGGYEIVHHQPHSRYFSRYPEGIEATVNWPDVNLVFRNDSAHNLVIKAEYTDTSLTVKLFGYNHGRALSGEWRNGQGQMQVIAHGGTGAKVVSAEISSRSRWTFPPQPAYVPNPILAVDERRYLQPALYGWTTRVTRTLHQDGRETSQAWRIKYLPMQAVIEVHPCVTFYSCPRVEDEEQTAPGT